MKNIPLSPEEQARVETEFIRDEAERIKIESIRRKERRNKFFADLPFGLIWTTWIFSTAFLLLEIFLRNISAVFVIFVVWTGVISLCVSRARHNPTQKSAEQ